jgi:hypothetical protein
MKPYRFFLNYFTIWDLCFTVILGFVLQPDPIGKNASVRLYGIASYLGPTIQMISVGFLIYITLNVLLSQLYCLIYRYSAVHDDKSFQQFFLSVKAKVVCIVFGQLFSISLAILGYHVFVKPEVGYLGPI